MAVHKAGREAYCIHSGSLGGGNGDYSGCGNDSSGRLVVAGTISSLNGVRVCRSVGVGIGASVG